MTSKAAWQAGVVATDTPNSVVDAHGLGFGRTADPALLTPFVERYHEVLEQVWAERTHAIAEGIVIGFYPMALAGPELLATTQAWLDEHPDAPAGLRRTVAESRDAVEDVIEPYLLQQGFIQRTPRGRVACAKAYAHLGLSPPQRPAAQPGLFEAG